MRFFLFVLMLAVLPLRSMGEVSIDQLLDKLNSTTITEKKVIAYQEVVTYYAKKDPDSAIWYAEQGLQFALKNKYVLGEGLMISELGYIDRTQGRVDVARKRFNTALQIFIENNYPLGVANMNRSLGALEGEKGDLTVAAKYFLAALPTYDSLKDHKGAMITYLNLGNLFLQHDDTTNGFKYFALGKKESELFPMIDETISLYNMLGLMHLWRKDTANALKIINKNLELSAKPEFLYAHVECLMYLGNFYMERGDKVRAMEYLEKGYLLAKEKKMYEEESNFLMLFAYMEREGNPKKALDYLYQANKMADNIQNKLFKVHVYNEIVATCKLAGMYKEALAASEENQRLIDSMYSVNRLKELASVNAAYEFDQWNLKVNHLQLQSDKRALQRNIIIAIAVLVIAALVVALNFYRKTKQLNIKLTDRERQLEELNRMKDKLFSIIGHDLRGPIARIPTLLDIYSDHRTSDDDKAYLMNSLKEHTKASAEMLDKLLYWGQSVIKGKGLNQTIMATSPIIKDNLELKKMAMAEKQITVVDKTPADMKIFADATHFDFIMRNLLANAIKYTNKGGNIELRADDRSKPGFVVFAVQDDGVGISASTLPLVFNTLNSREGTAAEKGTGIGLMLCREFALQNGGEIWVDSVEGKGATFYFSMKVAR